MDLTPPDPGAGGALRSSIITFRKGRASAIARNCVHGFRVESTGGTTRLHTNFEQPLKAHAIRDWISSHPKLVAPVIVFLIGSITYTVWLNVSESQRILMYFIRYLTPYGYSVSRVNCWTASTTKVSQVSLWQVRILNTRFRIDGVSVAEA